MPPPFSLATNFFDLIRLILKKVKHNKNKNNNNYVDSGDKIVIEKEQKYTVLVLKNEFL